jgi:histone deacetylase 11
MGPMKNVREARQGRPVGGVAVVYSSHYEINLGGAEELHPFDIHKYGRIYRRLVDDGLIAPADVYVPEEVTREQILLVHSEAFLRSLEDPATVARYLEAKPVKVLPAKAVDAGLLSAFRRATGGTILAGRQAWRHGIGINLAGGYHHAGRDQGEGFNVYNDLAIAIRTLQEEDFIHTAMVIDLDVHQGNGTAEIFAGDDTVYTFSMHQGDIYPIPKATSDRDVELPAGTSDEDYMRKIIRHVPLIIAHHRPDMVFIQAGCDTLAGDPLASLRMTPEGIVKRDAMVIKFCRRMGIPVVYTLGGGYSDEAWKIQYLSIRRTLETYGGVRARPRKVTKGKG